MRKIKSQEQIEKEKARNIKMMSFFMLLIMILGTIGFAFSGGFGFSDNSNGINEDANEQELVFNQPVILYQNERIPITMEKKFVEDVIFEINFDINKYLGNIVYVDGEDFVVSEIQNTIGKFSNVRRACYGKCEGDFPEKTCNDNLIVFKRADENIVRQDKNCVFIDGSLKAVDAFIYKIFGA